MFHLSYHFTIDRCNSGAIGVSILLLILSIWRLLLFFNAIVDKFLLLLFVKFDLKRLLIMEGLLINYLLRVAATSRIASRDWIVIALSRCSFAENLLLSLLVTDGFEAHLLDMCGLVSYILIGVDLSLWLSILDL